MYLVREPADEAPPMRLQFDDIAVIRRTILVEIGRAKASEV